MNQERHGAIFLPSLFGFLFPVRQTPVLKADECGISRADEHQTGTSANVLASDADITERFERAIRARSSCRMAGSKIS